MTYDVVVVGGGIGGLTVAALLSARGVKTCLLDRQSQVGGCIGRVEFSGYDFEPGMGLYNGFGANEIFTQIFSELETSAPQTTLIDEDYVVRMVGRAADIQLRKDDAELYETLRQRFPECADATVEFYKTVKRVNESWENKEREETKRSLLSKAFRKFRSPSRSDDILATLTSQTVSSVAKNTSPGFQQFINAQIGAVLQTTIERCAFVPACLALNLLRSNNYSIAGGTATIAESLADSIKSSGGAIRLNSPVLRLAYNETGDAIGVDLLTGERVLAKLAIVSNLTVWDTYGKLVGLNKTSAEMKARLANYSNAGSYLVYAAVEDTTVQRLPSQNFIVGGAAPNEDENLSAEFTVNVQPCAPDGKHPATIKSATEVTPWFSFQASEEDLSEWDQRTLEAAWTRLHQHVPELGSGIEVIETANPRTTYNSTRRKLGMVLGVEPTIENWTTRGSCQTEIPNLFMVGDTVKPTFGISEVAATALELADLLTK